MMDEFCITEDQKKHLTKVATDLKVQAMMFDMAIDWETLQLEPKSTYKHPFWVTRYREQLSNSDYMIDGSDDQEYDDER